MTWFLATEKATWGSQGEGERRKKKLPTFVVQCVHDEGELLEEIHVILRAAWINTSVSSASILTIVHTHLRIKSW